MVDVVCNLSFIFYNLLRTYFAWWFAYSLLFTIALAASICYTFVERMFKPNELKNNVLFIDWLIFIKLNYGFYIYK